MSQLIDWPGIRAAAVALQSVREAAMRASAHLPPNEQRRLVERINKRAYRERWLDHAKALAKPRDNGSLPLSKPVQNGSDSLAIALNEHKNATRMSLAKSVRSMAQKAEKAKLAQSSRVLDVARTAGATFEDWQPKQGTQTNVMVNVALLGIDPGSIQATD